jgi:hypothetical protein
MKRLRIVVNTIFLLFTEQEWRREKLNGLSYFPHTLPGANRTHDLSFLAQCFSPDHTNFYRRRAFYLYVSGPMVTVQQNDRKSILSQHYLSISYLNPWTLKLCRKLKVIII